VIADCWLVGASQQRDDKNACRPGVSASPGRAPAGAGRVKKENGWDDRNGSRASQPVYPAKTVSVVQKNKGPQVIRGQGGSTTPCCAELPTELRTCTTFAKLGRPVRTLPLSQLPFSPCSGLQKDDTDLHRSLPRTRPSFSGASTKGRRHPFHNPVPFVLSSKVLSVAFIS